MRLTFQQKLIIGLVAIAGLIGCEGLLPDEFKSDTLDTSMSMLDDGACDLVGRELIRHDTSWIEITPDSSIVDTVIHDTLFIEQYAVSNNRTSIIDSALMSTEPPDTIWIPVDTLIIDTAVDPPDTSIKEIMRAFESVAALLDSIRILTDTVNIDTSILLNHANNGQAAFLSFEPAPGEDHFIIFTDEYLDFIFIDSSGLLILPTQTGMDLELISGCTTIERDNSGVIKSGAVAEPIIKARYEFQVSAGSYLIRVDIPKQTVKRKIRLAIIND